MNHSPDVWEAWTAIAGAIALLALAAVIALQIEKHRREANDQKTILRLRLVVVAAEEVPEGFVLAESHLRRSLRRVPDHRDGTLRRTEQAVGKICNEALARGKVLNQSMLKEPAVAKVDEAVHLPVTVDARLASGLKTGDRVVFAKEGKVVPELAGTTPHGYELLGVERTGQGDDPVILKVSIPSTDLATAAALADEGWYPVRVPAPPADEPKEASG